MAFFYKKVCYLKKVRNKLLNILTLNLGKNLNSQLSWLWMWLSIHAIHNVQTGYVRELNWAQTQALQIGVYASVMYELKADDVTFIPGKSRIFFFQRGFQQFKCEYLYSATSIKLILIFISWKTAANKVFNKYKRFCIK